MKSLGARSTLLGPYQAAGAFTMRAWAEQNRETRRTLISRPMSSRCASCAIPRIGPRTSPCWWTKLEAPKDIAERTSTCWSIRLSASRPTRSSTGGLPQPDGAARRDRGQAGAPPERYVDLGYYERAMSMLGRSNTPSPVARTPPSKGGVGEGALQPVIRIRGAHFPACLDREALLDQLDDGRGGSPGEGELDTFHANAWPPLRCRLQSGR